MCGRPDGWWGRVARGGHAWVAASSVVLALPVAAAAQAGGGAAEGIGSFAEPRFLLSVGSIVEPDEIDHGARVLGTEREGAIRERSLTPPDRVHVPRVIDERPLGIGQRLQLYRTGETILDPVDETPLGLLRVPTGIGEVDTVAGEAATVRLTRAYRPVQVGDYVRTVGPADTLPPVASGERLRPVEGRVVAFQEEKAVHPPMDIVFLRDDDRALEAGDVVLVFRPGPRSEGVELPEVRVAVAVIVRPGRVPAAILTRTFRSDVGVGDLYRRTTLPAF